MTQEELDALMSGATDDIDALNDEAEEVSAEQEAVALEIEKSVETKAQNEDVSTPPGYSEETSNQ